MTRYLAANDVSKGCVPHKPSRRAAGNIEALPDEMAFTIENPPRGVPADYR